jgi:uncharacterized protein YraI
LYYNGKDIFSHSSSQAAMRISPASAILLSLSLVLSACTPVVYAAALPQAAATATPTPTGLPTPVVELLTLDPTITPLPTVTPGPGELVWPSLNEPSGIVSSTGLLRAGPGAEYPVVMAALGGMNFKILGKSADGNYYQVILPVDIVQAGNGWISADSLFPRNVEQLRVVAAPPLISAMGLSVAAGTALSAPQVTINLRFGPDFAYPVIGFALRGEVFPVTGQSEDGLWLRLRVPFPVSADGNAWVYSANLQTLVSGNVPVIKNSLAPWINWDQAGPACPLLSNSMLYKNTFGPSQYFTAEFEVLNNTENTWSKGDIDVAFLAAWNDRAFHVSPDRSDLPRPIEVGQTYKVTIDGQAWDQPGFYREVWAMANGDDSVCLILIDIWVVKPQ